MRDVLPRSVLCWKTINVLCFSVAFSSSLVWRREDNKRGLYFSLGCGPAPCDCNYRAVGGCLLPVCQRPTSLVHFDIHMGAVMILKAAIKLTVAFQGSAWCRHCAAPIIRSGNTPWRTEFSLLLDLFLSSHNLISLSKYPMIAHAVFPWVDIMNFNLQSSKIQRMFLISYIKNFSGAKCYTAVAIVDVESRVIIVQ